MKRPEEQELLGRGITEYADALNAISAFSSLVQKKCRRVVEENLAEYSAALGIELSKNSFVDYTSSDSYGTEFDIGVRCTKKRPHTEIGTCLYWYRGGGDRFEPGLYMFVWARKKYLDRLREVLRAKGIATDDEDDETVYLYKGITADDVGRIDTHLDALMEKWLELWRKAGGVKVLGNEPD
jgi:hypothetical protein